MQVAATKVEEAQRAAAAEKAAKDSAIAEREAAKHAAAGQVQAAWKSGAAAAAADLARARSAAAAEATADAEHFYSEKFKKYREAEEARRSEVGERLKQVQMLLDEALEKVEVLQRRVSQLEEERNRAREKVR